jgi:hypothetical protein
MPKLSSNSRELAWQAGAMSSKNRAQRPRLSAYAHGHVGGVVKQGVEASAAARTLTCMLLANSNCKGLHIAHSMPARLWVHAHALLPSNQALNSALQGQATGEGLRGRARASTMMEVSLCR